MNFFEVVTADYLVGTKHLNNLSVCAVFMFGYTYLQLYAVQNVLSVNQQLLTTALFVQIPNCMYKTGDVYTHVEWDSTHHHQVCVSPAMKHVTHVLRGHSIIVPCVNLD